MTPTVLDEVNRLMQQIIAWKLPETGKYYDAEQQHPMSYEMCYGSNGAREYVRNLAQDALSLLVTSSETTVTPPDYKEQRDFLLTEMEKLACLGNGDKYGNSEGNCIAIAAIKKCKRE